MVSNEEWGTAEGAGVYSLEARPGGKVTCLQRVDGMANTAAALYRGNIMYAVEASLYDGFRYLSYSTSTWSAGTREEIDMVNVPSDLTYDPVTDKVYGGFWDEDYGGFSRFCSFSVITAEARDIEIQPAMSATSLPLRLPTTALYMRFSVLSTILCLSTRVQGLWSA